MFRSMLGRVLEGLSNIGPVKNLIKYILDRSLNELLSDQISLDDFKKGQLVLSKVSLNLEKINREYLLSSPYILHQGTLRGLRITLPGWSELSTKSIEVVAEGLQLDLKPNKQFADNFKDVMRERQSEVFIEQQTEQGELNENNPLDFFRQLVKQIVLNMKIRIQNSAIRLFINEPTVELTAKPQYYLMTRVPLITVGRSEDIVIAKEEDTEELKFNLVVPQISIHLLREGTAFPEFANEKARKEDFPFSYPTIAHPSTILVVGRAEKQNKEQATRLTFTLTTFYKKQKKIIVLDGKIGSLESSIDPIQLKIISRFFAQINQFQKVLRSVMVELGLNSIRQSQNLMMSRKDSRGKSGNFDLMTSIMISITQQPVRNSLSKETELYNSMMQVPEMANAANEFNKKAASQLKKSGEITEEGLKNIAFKQQMRVSLCLNTLQANFLKYVTSNNYLRQWAVDLAPQAINGSLACSHYRLVLKGLCYSFLSSSNLHQAKMRYVKLHDVRLKEQSSIHNDGSQQFFDLESSSTFYNTNINQEGAVKKSDLLSFTLSKEQHYCLEELFKISEGQTVQVNNDRIKMHSFMPGGAECSESTGLAVAFNGDSKAFRVEIKDVAVMANFQVWKDVLNIAYPIFLYKKLAERINIQSQQVSVEEKKDFKNFELFESQYKFTGNFVEVVESKQQKMEFKIKIGLIYCFYREAGLKAKQDLLTEVEKKVLDSDNFSKECFCQLNERAIYAEVRQFSMTKISSEFNLSIGEVKAGLLSLENSKIGENIQPFLICEKLRIEESCVQTPENIKSSVQQNIIITRIFAPIIKFSVELPQLITFVDMVKKAVGIIDSLQCFKKNLAAKLLYIEQEILNQEKVVKEKNKKERVLEILVGDVELKMLLLSTYVRHLFFRKKGDEQQLRFEALAIGLAKKLQVHLGQFRNQLLTTAYPSTEKYNGINDVNLILEIGRDFKSKGSWVQPSPSKAIRKLERHLECFTEFDDSKKKQLYQSSLYVIVKESVDSGERNELKGAFKFNKKPSDRKNSVILEQKRTKVFKVMPIQPLMVHLSNLAFLLRHQKEIEDIVRQVTDVLTEIKVETKEMMNERKDSMESEAQSTNEIRIDVQTIVMQIDIRPDFIYNAEAAKRTLSNTRLFIAVQLQQIAVCMNPDTQQLSLDIKLDAKAHFLHYLDKDVELNPVLLSSQHLSALGFSEILALNGLHLNVSSNLRSNISDIECQVDTLKVNMCLSTLPYFKLFLDHFLQHTLAGNFGYDEDNNFEILQAEEKVEDAVEDLTEKLQQYQRMLDEKAKCQSAFLGQQFKINQTLQQPRVRVQLLKIGVIRIDLYGGNQFRFVEVNSLYESKATSRSRAQQIDLATCLSLEITSFRAKVEKASNVEVLAEIEKVNLQLSYKWEPLIWGSDKMLKISLFRIENPLKILAFISQSTMKVKLSRLELYSSFTDQIFMLAQQYQIAANSIEKSNWKRMYRQQKAEISKRMLLLFLPQGKITTSVQYKRAKILSERNLRLPKLLVHEEESNSKLIVSLITTWAMDVFKSNLGTLVSGAVFEVLSTCIGLLLNGMRHFLALFFPSLKD